VHWYLGMILQQQGRVPPARAEYEAALKLRPDFRPAAESLAKLK
jgi:Flp pilus assembly protein TadD